MHIYFWSLMAKELYLYFSVQNFVIADLLEKMEEAADDDIVMRINSPGGSVFAGWGLVAKLKEHANTSTAKVDGMAVSMAAIMLLYFDNVECMDVSRFMLHRGDMYVESEEDLKFLADINNDIRLQMKKKLDSKKFKDITGYTIDQMFTMEERKDFWLTAKQAKEIGLVQKVNKLSPAAQTEIAAMTEKFYNVAASGDPKPNPMSENTMTVDKLKAEHPEVSDKLLIAGVNAERERVKAWLAYLDADPERVVKAIKEGTELTQSVQAELHVKLVQAGTKKKIEEGNPKTPGSNDTDPEADEAKGMTITMRDGTKKEFSAEQVKEAHSFMSDAVLAAKKRLNPEFKAS